MKLKNIIFALLVSSVMMTPNVKANDASLSYEGDAEEFIKTNDETNAFVDMMPGEERTQIISLTNENFDAMKFFVKVDEAALLNAEGNIVYQITFKKDGEVFYTGIIGGKNKAGKGNLTENFLLKDLQKGESTNIEMSVKIDGTSMTNEYQGTQGNLGIIFSVEHASNNEVIELIKKIPVINTIPGVSTGDTTSIYTVIFTMVSSIGLLILIVLKKRRDDGNEKA